MYLTPSLSGANRGVGVANTMVGGANRWMGVANRRVGRANTRVGVANARMGVANRGVGGDPVFEMVLLKVEHFNTEVTPKRSV